MLPSCSYAGDRGIPACVMRAQHDSTRVAPRCSYLPAAPLQSLLINSALLSPSYSSFPSTGSRAWSSYALLAPNLSIYSSAPQRSRLLPRYCSQFTCSSAEVACSCSAAQWFPHGSAWWLRRVSPCQFHWLLPPGVAIARVQPWACRWWQRCFRPICYVLQWGGFPLFAEVWHAGPCVRPSVLPASSEPVILFAAGYTQPLFLQEQCGSNHAGE